MNFFMVTSYLGIISFNHCVLYLFTNEYKTFFLINKINTYYCFAIYLEHLANGFLKKHSSRGLIRSGMNDNSPLMFAVVERCHSDKVLPSDSEVKRRGISLRAGQ